MIEQCFCLDSACFGRELYAQTSGPPRIGALFSTARETSFAPDPFSIEMTPQETELDILEYIHTAPGTVRQRDLAGIVGKSLGMTNSILQRLAEKGLLVVSRVNNRNITYAVTPQGLREIAGRSFRYFKRTIKNVVFYKDVVEAEVRIFALGAPREHEKHLILQGNSDLDFILEHMASKYGFVWARYEDADRYSVPSAGSAPSVLLFLGEESSVSKAYGEDRTEANQDATFRLVALRDLIESSHVSTTVPGQI